LLPALLFPDFSLIPDGLDDPARLGKKEIAGNRILVCIESDILDKLVHDLSSSIMALSRRPYVLSLIHGAEDG
jgi:hypothetical protein